MENSGHASPLRSSIRCIQAVSTKPRSTRSNENQILNRKGGFYEFRKQFISCEEKMRTVTGGCGGKIGCQQADDLKMGNRGFT